MKRTLFLLALVMGVAAAGYYGYQRFQSEQTEKAALTALAYVPADTPFFFGALESRDWSEWLQLASGQALTPPPETMAELLDKLSGAGAAGGLLYGFYSLYLDLLADPLTIPARTGVELDSVSMIYGIGLVPVMRQSLADPAAFTAFLDEAERRGKISHQFGEFQGIPLRRYAFGENSALELVVAIHEDAAIITLDTPVEREGVLALALGLQRPAASLADTGLAHEVAARHGFDPAAVGFINHRAVVDGLVGGDGSRLAGMLTALGADVEQQLAPLRTPGCRRDLPAIAERWPLTAFGYTELNPQAGSATMEAVLVANDESQMQDLLKLQGHIPPGLAQQGGAAPMAAAALGLDIDALAPVVQSLWQRFTSAEYQCEFLVAAQQELRQRNPALLALGTAMFSGIRGVGVAVYELQADAGGPQLDSLRALLTLSADDPAAVLSRIQALNPNLAALRIPADGSAVELPPLFEQDLPPLMIAIHGQHLVIFTGSVPDGVLAALAAEPLTANGLWWMRLDYARLTPLLEQAIANVATTSEVSTEEAAAVQEQLRQFGTLDMAAEFGLDVSGKGVILRSSVEMGADQNQN